MKKIIIIIVGLALILTAIGIGGYYLYRDYQIKHAKIIVELNDNLSIPFLGEAKLSNFIKNINGTLIKDIEIDTSTPGKKNVSFEYINEDKIKVKYDFDIDVIDDVPPVIWLSGSYSVARGSNINLTDKILCGDNLDDNPLCEIIGDYDINVTGTYPLTFKATDKSGNITEKAFNLNVYEPISNSGGNNNSKPTYTYFSDVIENYKTDNTEIGLDISEWQGSVNFEKLKNAGVEFVILRVGGTKGIKGDYFLDARFTENIEKANAIGMPVGIYFYSYANSKEKALKDAAWIYEQIKPYKIDLPIAFDWENWSFYNEFNLSFFNLTNMANSFLDYFKEKGYDGLLYSSKAYLEDIWLPSNYPTWLAHYTKQTNYTGKYEYWQLCSDGIVDGINGAVDINIRYKN